MACCAEARAPVVARADLRLAEAAIPCRPTHAVVSRDDLSKCLYSDPWRTEERADGTPAHSAADAPSQGRHHQDWESSSIPSTSANGRASWSNAPCQLTG